MEYQYFFDGIREGRYLVVAKRYRYTAPIYVPDSEIASTSEHKFMVCEGTYPNYPASEEMTEYYSAAVSVWMI